MRSYTVQRGDTPASIAAQNSMAGCPKCSRDLIGVNGHKQAVAYPNGYLSFADLYVGENLNLPEKWFDGTLDTRPKAYFAALPNIDGITPSTLGDAASGVLADYATLDALTAQLSSLPQLSDREFALAADVIAALVDKSVSEASSVSQSIDAKAAAEWVRRRALEMAAAVEAGDIAAASAARPEIQNVLLTAADSARKALDTFYASPEPKPNIDLVSLAQRAANAIASDPNYCASVAIVGSPVNAAVHAFKSAWNSKNPSDRVPINTGNFEQATAAALATVTGSSFAGCTPRASKPPTVKPPAPSKTTVTSPEKELSVGEILGIGLVGAGAVGTVIYLATKKPPQRQRRYL